MKLSRFSRRALALDFEKDILPLEQRLINEYGFVKEEVNFMVRHRPSIILLDQEKDVGIPVLHRFFVEKKGFDIDTMRTLVVKYPYIAGKTEQQLNHFFETLKAQGLKEEEIMQALLEIPKLISMDIDKQIKDITFLFNLYHGFSIQEVMDIFKQFPYLLCCDADKIQRYMAEFRKYQFTKEQIYRLVIQCIY